MNKKNLHLNDFELLFDRKKNKIKGNINFKESKIHLFFYLEKDEMIFEIDRHTYEEKLMIESWMEEEKEFFEKSVDHYLQEIETFKNVLAIENSTITSEHFEEVDILGKKFINHNLYFTLGSFDCCFLFRIHPFQTKPAISFEPMYSNENIPVTVYIENFLTKQQTRNLWEYMLKRSKHRLRIALVKEDDMEIQ